MWVHRTFTWSTRYFPFGGPHQTGPIEAREASPDEGLCAVHRTSSQVPSSAPASVDSRLHGVSWYHISLTQVRAPFGATPPGKVHPSEQCRSCLAAAVSRQWILVPRRISFGRRSIPLALAVSIASLSHGPHGAGDHLARQLMLCRDVSLPPAQCDETRESALVALINAAAPSCSDHYFCNGPSLPSFSPSSFRASILLAKVRNLE